MNKWDRRQHETEPYGVYGRHLAKSIGLPEVPAHVQRTLKQGILAVSLLKIEHSLPELASVRCESAFVIPVHLQDVVKHELWFDQRLVTRAPFKAGHTHIYNLELDPQARVFQPLNSIVFYLPRNSMDEFAEANRLSRVDSLTFTTEDGVDDPIMTYMAQAILHAFKHPYASSGLLFDQMLNTVCGHVLTRYGNAHLLSAVDIRGLAPWQERRAKELMDELLDISLPEVAERCHLSVTHFVRAFRGSTGLSPHQWLIRRRVSRAMTLLSSSNLGIADIALACGFSSQSHLSRAFSAQTGMPPGRWRRLRQLPPRE